MNHNKIHLLDLRVFRAIDEPNLARKFHNGHIDQLKQNNVDLLEFFSDQWIQNPNVYLIAISSGEKLIGGSRLHFYHPDYSYPMENAFNKRLDVYESLDRNSSLYQAEWCGLWISSKFREYGLAQVISRCALAFAHKSGLEIIYGLCPRHTMDLFRRFGYHFFTHKDMMCTFSYPTEEYTSYIIECEVKTFRFTFREEIKKIMEILETGGVKVNSSGLLGDAITSINELPEVPNEILKRPMKIPIASSRIEAHTNV